MDKSKTQPELEGALFVDDGEEALNTRGFDDDQDDEQDNEPFVHPNDGKAERAIDTLNDLLDHMGFDADVSIRKDERKIIINVEGPDSGRVIGKKGQTLDAMQFFLNKVVNRHAEGRRHVVLDSGDYRERHDHSLVSMARRLAKRAMQYGRIITLEPMSARDRRVIHMALAKTNGVSTRSDGQGSDRRVQIVPARRRGRGGRDSGGDSDRSLDRDVDARDRDDRAGNESGGGLF